MNDGALTHAEEQIVRWMREGRLDAEIAVRLQVRGDGECLRVRSKPGTTGDILGCAEDGSLVTVRQPVWEEPNITGDWPPDQPYQGTVVHYNPDDEIRFAYVATGELDGWVAMEFLGWPE